jgi:hypothetical protein
MYSGGRDRSEKRIQEKITMAEKPKCERCGKDAIGIQSFGYCVNYVCQDHADGLLLALKFGEKRAYDECYLERFDNSDH